MMGSGSADQLSIEVRGSETYLPPVQRVKLYDSPELLEILSGLARYPVQHDSG